MNAGKIEIAGYKGPAPKFLYRPGKRGGICVFYEPARSPWPARTMNVFWGWRSNTPCGQCAVAELRLGTSFWLN